jgi:hypothetical protein
MSYPHQQEIGLWLKNWVCWTPTSFGQSQWRDTVSSHVYDGAPVPIMSGEASDTQDALARMDRGERGLLMQFHLGSAPVRVLAKRRRVSMDTVERQLHSAHHHFYEIRWRLKTDAQAVAAENARRAEVGRQNLQRKTAEFRLRNLLAKA